MRRSLVKFSESEASNHTPSLADFTTTTPELKFSVHTPLGFLGSSYAARVYLIADSAFIRMQVDAPGACWLDAGEHDRGLALRTGGAPNCNEWNDGRQALRLGHDASLE